MSRLRKVIAKRMVESLQTSRPADHGGRGRRHRDRPAARPVKADFEAREGVKLSFLPFFAKAAIDALKAAPEAQRRDRHREGRGHLLRPREPRDRGRHRAGLLTPVIKDAGDLSIAGPGPQDRRRRRAHPHQQDHPGRAVRRHVHADQHRQPRRAVRHPDHQPAAGGDPRHRRRRQAPGRDRRPEPRRDDRGPLRWSTSRSPTTTGSSTAPTPPASSPTSSSASRQAQFEV
jgi:hypothetical protein